MKDLLKNKQKKEGVKVRMFTRKEKGFTLIELLVVIAIIAILAAILFPVFAKAREKARQSSCQSNIKQIALSLNMYSQDYDECFPAQGAVGTASTATIDSNYISADVNTPSWVGSLAPYMKSTKIFVCPTIGTGGKAIPVSYAANAYVLNTIASGLLKPTETVLIIDFPQVTTAETYTKIAYDITPNTGMSVHSDGANIGFIDGHVKWMKGSDAATKLVWKADGTL